MEAAMERGPAPVDRRRGRGGPQAAFPYRIDDRIHLDRRFRLHAAGSMNSSVSFLTLSVGALAHLFTEA